MPPPRPMRRIRRSGHRPYRASDPPQDARSGRLAFPRPGLLQHVNILSAQFDCKRFPAWELRQISALLLAVAQPAIDGTQHVGIIVGPDPLLVVGFGLS